MKSENRPYRNSELYLGLDFVKLFGITMILVALAGPLSERIIMVMLGEPVGTAAGACTLLLLSSVCLFIFIISLFNITSYWRTNRDGEIMNETKLDIDETLERINNLNKEIKRNKKKYEETKRRMMDLEQLSQFLNTDFDTVYQLVETNWHEIMSQDTSEEVQND